MSAFANNPWVMKDKNKKKEEEEKPIKKANPRKVVTKNPFGKNDESTEEQVS